METLKIATYWWAGRRQVGRLSADERDVLPLALGERAHAVGALALVEAMAAGAPFPKLAGPALPMSAVKLDAPIPGTHTCVRCWVNEELRQDAPTEDPVFDIPTLISTISAGIMLHPGDIIATGTPSGDGIGFDPPKYLRRGDRVRIDIEGIGTLSNPVQ